jgi:hypothetical protein
MSTSLSNRTDSFPAKTHAGTAVPSDPMVPSKIATDGPVEGPPGHVPASGVGWPRSNELGRDLQWLMTVRDLDWTIAPRLGAGDG